MYPQKFIKMLLLVELFLAPLMVAHGHDPGLSRSIIRLDDQGMVMRMELALWDVELLFSIDSNRDGTVSAEEFSDAQSRLQLQISSTVEVQTTAGNIQAESIRVALDSAETVNFVLHFHYPVSSDIRLRVPLVSQLSRGHRQYLTVRDTNGKLLAQHILDANSPALLLDGAGPERQYPNQ